MKSKKNIGIDILKTIAIISVVLYHINGQRFPGGFIGVDLFFVISGYLLSNSLVKEYKKNKTIDFFGNITKKIRQLWPTLFIMIFTVTIFITIFNKPVLDVSNKDAIAGMTFTSNWWYIFNKVGYFDSFTLSPFKHLWYVGVLIQSYIIIVFLFKGFYNVKIFKKLDLFKVFMILIALISYYRQVKLYSFDDVSRVYYGTDTRIYTIIIGVLGYFIYPMDKLMKVKNSKAFVLSNTLSIVSLIVYLNFIKKVSEVYPWVYQFGFLIFAINSLIMVFSFGSAANLLTKLLSYIPFSRTIGKLSYGIYLWHFPIIVLTQLNIEKGNPNLLYTILRIIVFIALAYITTEYVEKPISRKGFIKYLDDLNIGLLLKNAVFYVFFAIFILGLAGISIPFISTAFVDTSRDINLENEIITENNNKGIEENNKDIEEDNNQEENINTDENIEDANIDQNNVKQNTINEDKKDLEKELLYDQIILIGDSLGVNVGSRLLEMYPNTIVDAKISRQLNKSKEVFQKYMNYDSEKTAIVMMLGTNGYFKEESLEELFNLYPKSKKIIVNVKMPDSWEKTVNDTFDSYVSKHPEVSLVDWNSVARNNPDYLAGDQTHLMRSGVNKVIDMILENLTR